MPCYVDEEPELRADVEGLRKQRDHLTRLLCMACDHLCQGGVVIDPELATWKRQHDLADELRITREKVESAKKRAQRVAHLRSQVAALGAQRARYVAELADLEGGGS